MPGMKESLSWINIHLLSVLNAQAVEAIKNPKRSLISAPGENAEWVEEEIVAQITSARGAQQIHHKKFFAFRSCCGA